MDCGRLRELYLMGDESPLGEHARDCSECGNWLERERRLLAALKDLRSEAGKAVQDLPLKRVPGYYWVKRAVLAVAATLILTLALSVVVPRHESPSLSVTRVVLIEGTVKDHSAPPAFIDVDGRRFEVHRISQDEGIWRAELQVPADKKVFLLSARDANGNERRMELRLTE